MAESPPRVLILHVTAGAGHTKAAEAIERAIALRHPGTQVKCDDSLEYTNPVYKRLYSNTYLLMVKRTPALWGYFYDRYDEDRHPREEKLRQLIDEFQSFDLRMLCQAYEPDAIVCTHFLPLDVLTRWKQREGLNVPIFGVVTDFDAHSFWINPDIDTYFVATEDVGRTLLKRGIAQDRIAVTGIPIDPAFGELGDQAACKAQLGFKADQPLVLILSGGFGVGDIVDMVASFREASFPYQLAVVSGRNKSLKERLEKLAPELSLPVKVLGFVTNMREYMNAADLIASKPGGLTTSEVLAIGRPMLIIDPIPGQEQRNSDYLLEQGAATTLHHLDDAAFYVERLLRDPARLARMAEHARTIGRPGAAAEIAARVMAAVAERRARGGKLVGAGRGRLSRWWAAIKSGVSRLWPSPTMPAGPPPRSGETGSGS